MTTLQLASLVVQLLDMQKAYFKAPRDSAEKAQLLTECKAAERHLRNTCNAMLNPAVQTPALFTNDKITPH